MRMGCREVGFQAKKRMIRSWAHAFKENGFHENFHRLSDFIMARLEYTEKPAVNSEVPSLLTFARCFPA